MANAGSLPPGSASLTHRPIYEAVGSECIARGSAADIWKITQPGSGQRSLYILKVLRVSPEDFDSSAGTRDDSQSNSSPLSWAHFMKIYKDKVSEWVPLAHTNLVRVFDLQDDLNLLVEYCPNGCIRDYFKTDARRHMNKQQIVSDVLAGLTYLHTRDPPIIHGGLNAGKLFVDARGRTKIGEFGLASLCYYLAPLVPSVVFTGFSRWMSPELFDLNPDGTSVLPTVASDIWALGCTIFEVISEQLPYSGYKHDVRVKRAISKGEPPGRRDTSSEDQYSSELWSAIESCWSMNPSQRPITGATLWKLVVTQERMRVEDQIDAPPPGVVDQLSTYDDEELTEASRDRSRMPSEEYRPYEEGRDDPGLNEEAGFQGRVVNPLLPGEYEAPHQVQILAPRGTRGLRTGDALRRGRQIRVEAKSRVLGSDDPDTLASFVDSAVALGEQGRLAEAEAMLLEALVAQTHVLGDNHPDTLITKANLASVCGQQGRLRDAEIFLLEIVAVQEQTLGEEHSDTLSTRANLAVAYGEQGRLTEASTLLRQVIAVQSRVLGEDHEDTKRSRINLAVANGEI